MITQPVLYVPPEIELRILAGELFRSGSVVREVANGRILKHLKEIVPEPQQVEQAIRSVRLDRKIVVPVVAIMAIIGGGTAYVIKRRKKSIERVDSTPVPDCVANFEDSLRVYVDAGRKGTLDAEIVSQLISDLDAVKAFSDGGDAVEFSLDQLIPLLELVINHTSALADAYSAELDDLKSKQASSASDTVSDLRRHLEVQKRILVEAA